MNNDLFKAGVSRRGFLTGSAALCAMAGLGLARRGGAGGRGGGAPGPRPEGGECGGPANARPPGAAGLAPPTPPPRFAI